MAGKTPKEAADEFVKFLRESLSCLSDHFVTAFQPSPKLYKVYYEPYAKVCDYEYTDYEVSVVQVFRTVPDALQEKQFKAKTQEYSYTLLKDGQEIVSYHWHPNDPGVSYPHLHIHEKALRRIHFPTSRVCLEDFILMLFRDFKIRPNVSHAEYKEILEKNKRSFEKWATWKIQHG